MAPKKPIGKPGQKTKRQHDPPKLDHLPFEQAQKIKRAWVEEKMIKRAYHNEKKKMGLLKTGANQGAADAGWGVKRRRMDDEGVVEGPSTSGSTAQETTESHEPEGADDRTPKRRRTEKSPTDAAASNNQRRLETSSKPGHQTKRPSEAALSTDPAVHTASQPTAPSLRDLSRKAYAKSSLHTYKSDIRRHGEQKPGGKRPPSTPAPKLTNAKGQPNMKLRMEAMLERIQRTMGS